MNKQEFLTTLRRKVKWRSKSEADERIAFYSEMIDDYVEDGLTEDEAVAKIGNIDDISEQISSEADKEKVQKKNESGKIALFWIGSPLWIALALVAVAVVISLYAVLWAAVISLWAVFGSLVGVAFGGCIAAVVFGVSGNAVTGFAMVGAAIACGGLAIFAFYGCKAATKGACWLTKKVTCIKKIFTKKETLLEK